MTHCVARNPHGLVTERGEACLATTKFRAVARELQKESRRLGIVDRLAGLDGTASRLP
jgi:hypothetical protein